MEDITTPSEEIKKQDDTKETSRIYLDQQALVHLNETRNWTLFLAIMGFIAIGLLILAGIIVSLVFNTMKTPAMPGFFGVLYPVLFIVLGVLYFFPAYFLMQFSKFSSMTLRERSTELFSKAMKYLKYYYRYTGILVIVVISFYLIFFVVAFFMGNQLMPHHNMY
ncbi:MAG: hypothetical protein JXR71_13190 [Bacteroidales bacterium]|nr:hypothetical protein [Bacteroidales bacterium]